MNQLKLRGEPFTIEQTLYTKRVTVGDSVYKFINPASALKKSDFGIFSKVKSDIKKHLSAGVNVPRIDKRLIQYINCGKLSDVYEGEIYEIDLNSAFWEIAKKKGYISGETYNYGKKVDKRIRLMALGSLATVTTSFKFDGKEFSRPIITEKETADYFFSVAYETSLIMQDLQFMAREDFLMYWCDAVFIRGAPALKRCVDYLEDEEVLYKFYKCEKIEVKENAVTVHSKQHKKKVRTFNFEKRSRINTYKAISKTKKIGHGLHNSDKRNVSDNEPEEAR